MSSRSASEMLSIDDVNRLDRDGFVARLGGVFEHSPWIAEAAWATRPFADVGGLHAAMVAVVRGASMERRVDLLCAHPDLAGRAARAGTMTAHSTAEQGGAGLLSLSDEEYERLHRLNAAYRERFGFPFIIAVRRHDKASLLAAFEARLGNGRETEIEAALAEVFTITRLRLDAIFGAG